ncbi:DUF4351 domain-containing protein [Candidatus Venteria ishoeyi]|uniref:DUF4351 domain-containing protein n=1 Tax=Candidatus Venteria ishoeyi TaxID=1899563 RepID=UPI00255C4088|nr:DUF4351 domain-containing protein [Candidatus Venteria ishoeyi]
MKKGILEGELRGEAKSLIFLLEKKFGSLTENQSILIKQLDEKQLLACMERLFYCQSIDDVLNNNA